MDFIVDNWEVVFGGVGTAVVAAVLAWLFKRKRTKGGSSREQQATSGAGSQIIQAGRDASVGSFQANKESPKK